ncbi:CBS domain-containing protein [Thermanaerosceptrum fracticalcis]|uniref:CBS domain-containing protein n=1 Tax=Thermanaerosceptrum fracticalcis TaxID=1712410 RepID=A0A7G6E8C6_THEFR|nr:CBS domain-containing protein [Thermanaerosceptrum fracticalcis]
MTIQLTERQELIIKIVQDQGPITGEEIADLIGLTRATLRPDLALLTKSGLLEARPKVGYYYTGKSLSSKLSEEIKKLKVKDFKAIPAVVSDKSSVYDVIVALFVQDVGTIYIVSEGGILEGVVSRKDLLKIALGQVDIHKIPITVVMTRMPNIISTTPEESLLAAAQKLINHEIDSLPVVRPVTVEGRERLEVIGRVTKTTITKAFVELGADKLIQRGERP